MDVKIIKKESFNVIGKIGQGAADRGPQWIPALWEKANGNFNEISHLVKYTETGIPAGIWGAMSDISESFNRWGDEGKYLAGCETVEGAAAPEGWKLWRIPFQTYAVAACTDENYSQVFSYMLNEYLPCNGYDLIGAVHEFYPQDEEKGRLHLYFPILKNE